MSHLCVNIDFFWEWIQVSFVCEYGSLFREYIQVSFVCAYRSLLCVTLLSSDNMMSLLRVDFNFVCVQINVSLYVDIGLFCVCIQVYFVCELAERRQNDVSLCFSILFVCRYRSFFYLNVGLFFVCIQISFVCDFAQQRFGVATISKLLKIIGLFCRISSLLQGSFAKETYDFKEPTNHCHLIARRDDTIY